MSRAKREKTMQRGYKFPVSVIKFLEDLKKRGEIHSITGYILDRIEASPEYKKFIKERK